VYTVKKTFGNWHQKLGNHYQIIW